MGGIFNTVIEDLGDITKDISATLGTTDEGHETESAEPTEEQEPPKTTKQAVVDINDIPSEWNRGVLHDGEEAPEAAFELVNEEDVKKLVKIYGGSDLLCDARSQNNSDHDSNDQALGVHFNFNLPVAAGFTAGAKAGYSTTRHKSISVENSSRSSLIAISYGEVSLIQLLACLIGSPKINFPNEKEQIKPTAVFLEAVHVALQTAGTNKFKAFDELQLVFQRFGYYYPTLIKFGKATSTAEETSETDEQTKGNTKEGGINFGFSGIGAGADTSKSNQIEVIRKAELDKTKLRAYGGDSTVLMTHGIEKWAKTIKANQKVVARTNMRPIYNLLDDTTRQRVIDVYDFKEHNGHIRYGTEFTMKHADYGRYVYIDGERRIRDNAKDRDVRAYRGKVLYAYHEPADYGNPPLVKFKQILRTSEPRSDYAKFGHHVALELQSKDGPEPIQVTQLPLDHIGRLNKLFSKALSKDPEKEQIKHPYFVASVYRSSENENASKKRWEILTSEGHHGDEGFVTTDTEVTLKSNLISPKNAGIYLGLAKSGIKSDKVLSRSKEVAGRYVAGKYCPYPINEKSQVAWEFSARE
ncbi:hypothetical protein DFQ28_002713 [Apophysomyces sp. BC1034]|nr:hypothetical protein DFQ30_003014 [Apophysomyces sp. BC1015]KAG0189925.1 hypothetical protein DFQ28_002713 [Apophysomyces sp. BC1034]